MTRTKLPGAMILAICIAIASAYANEAQSVERDGCLQLLAMGPDPGGKSGAGVTPETTRTDHPAAGGPQTAIERKPDSNTVPEDNRNQTSAPREDGRDGSNAERVPSAPSPKQ